MNQHDLNLINFIENNIQILNYSTSLFNHIKLYDLQRDKLRDIATLDNLSLLDGKLSRSFELKLPRNRGKSTLILSYVIWHILRNKHLNCVGFHYCFICTNKSIATYHADLLHRLISKLPTEYQKIIWRDSKYEFKIGYSNYSITFNHKSYQRSYRGRYHDNCIIIYINDIINSYHTLATYWDKNWESPYADEYRDLENRVSAIINVTSE